MIDVVQALTPVNFSRGRGGQRILAIVVHVSEGSLDSMTNWFRNPDAKVSAHYAVARDGRVLQYVRDEDTAQHAGLKVRPTAPLVLEMGSINPNRYTIGIEHEGRAADEPTARQLEASAALIAELSRRHGIPLDAKHVIPHRAIRADKTCPGKIDVQELLQLAGAAGVPDRPQPGDVRFSDFLGERVVLTEYTSDTDYKFIRVSQLHGLGQPGSARWSLLRKV